MLRFLYPSARNPLDKPPQLVRALASAVSAKDKGCYKGHGLDAYSAEHLPDHAVSAPYPADLDAIVDGWSPVEELQQVLNSAVSGQQKQEALGSNEK